jgi:hypothetical protein
MGRTKAKGIFCVEDADWWNDLKLASSAQPGLTVLHQLPPYRTPYIHRDVGTRDEFDHCIKKWLQAGYAKYPILYLAFHGSEGAIQFGNLKKSENLVGLDELEEMLSNACHRRIVYFSSCDTLAVNGNRLNAFVRRTGALAVCGYSKYVDWLESHVFDLLFFREAQGNTFTIPGMRAIKNRIREEAGSFYEKLGFRMFVKKP